jgi:hypothetical protein
VKQARLLTRLPADGGLRRQERLYDSTLFWVMQEEVRELREKEQAARAVAAGAPLAGTMMALLLAEDEVELLLANDAAAVVDNGDVARMHAEAQLREEQRAAHAGAAAGAARQPPTTRPVGVTVAEQQASELLLSTLTRDEWAAENMAV